MVDVDDVIVKRCVKLKVRVPRGGTLYLKFHTSFNYYVIYVNHMVFKVITTHDQQSGFQGQPHVSRSNTWFKVNHGLKSTHSTALIEIQFMTSIILVRFGTGVPSSGNF